MIFKKHNKFKPYLSIEKADDHTVNPKRGWYSIYSFTLPERPDFEELQWCLKKQESLCLVRVCIGNYAARSFDTPALTVFEEILSFFARHDKDMILRIIYDDEGKGMEHEPAGLSQIQSAYGPAWQYHLQICCTYLHYTGTFYRKLGRNAYFQILRQTKPLSSDRQLLSCHKRRCRHGSAHARTAAQS